MDSMDFKSMKRRELQALCKKHGLPANSTNSQMVLGLASLLQINEKIKLRGCLKGSDENSRDNSGPKKVSFSLEDDEFEFGKSLGKPEKRRSIRRASTGVITADYRKTRVPEIPARITRSRALEVVPQNRDGDFLCDERKKRKEPCAVGSKIRTLRNRVVMVLENEGELLGNQKPRRGLRRNAGTQKEDNVGAFQNVKLGEDEVFENKPSRKRSRVADVEEAPECNSEYGNKRPESSEVDAVADVKLSHCGGPPLRRSKRTLLSTETVVFDAGAVKKVETFPKRSTRSNVKCNVVETKNTCKIGVEECEATEGFKQIDDVARQQDLIASPGTQTESEVLAVPNEGVVARRSTRHSTKNEALLTSVLQNSVKKQTVVARPSTRHSAKNDALLTSVLQNAVRKQTVVVRRSTRHSAKNDALLTSVLPTVSVKVGKKSTTKRAREVVPGEDVTYVERDASGGFAGTRNQANGIIVDGHDRKPESHVTNTRRSKSCRRVNSIDEARQGEHSADPLLSLLEDSCQDSFIDKGSTRDVSSESQHSQSLQGIGKMFPNPQQNSVDNICKRCGDDDKLVDEHKCSEDQVCVAQEDQVMISGSSEVMGVLETLEASPCSAVQDTCAQNEDEEKISEAMHSVLVDTRHSSLSMHADGSFGLVGTVAEAVGNPQMDTLQTDKPTTKELAVCCDCVENVEQVDTAELRHEFIDSVTTPAAVAHQYDKVVDVISNIQNEDDSKHIELSHSADGISLAGEGIRELASAIGTEVSLGIGQEELAMASDVPDASEIPSHFIGFSNDTHVNNSEDSSDQQSAPMKDMGTEEATPTTMFVFQSIAEIDEIKEADKNSTDSCSGRLVFDESKEFLVPDSENLALSVALQEDGAEYVGDQMKQSLLVDRLSSDRCPSMKPRETPKSLYCFEISHDGSSSHNHMVATRPEVRMSENKETSAPEHVVALIVEKDSNLEVLDGIEAKNYSEMNSGCNGSLEGKFCEDSIDLLLPTAGDLLEKRDEGTGMAAKDIEFPLISENVACEMEVIEKDAVLDVLDGIDAKNLSELEGDCNTSAEERFCEVSIDPLPPISGDLLEKGDENIEMAAKDIEFPLLSVNVACDMDVMEMGTVLEILDGVDAKNHSELEGGCNTSIEERFCEVNIDPLPPNAGDLLEKRDENIEMAAKDTEFRLVSEVLACEIKVISEKPDCLDPEEDGAASESQLQMDHENATLLRLDGKVIDSKSGVQNVIHEVVGEDASENYDSCHEDGEKDNEGTKFSSTDVVLQQFIFREEASVGTVFKDFQQIDCEEASMQMKIQGGDEMASHLNSYSTVDSVDIPDPETHNSSCLQADIENQVDAPSMFAREPVVFGDDSQTCVTFPRDLENSTTTYFPVARVKVSVEIGSGRHDDEKVLQVRRPLVTDDPGFQLCSNGLMQQHTDEEPAEDNLKVGSGSFDSGSSIKEPNPLLYSLTVGGVSADVDSSNANTTVASDNKQVSASPCNFHDDQDCVSLSSVDDLKSIKEMETHAFNCQLIDIDEAAKHDFVAASDDPNKENMENSGGDVMAGEDGNETVRVLQRNTPPQNVPFLLQRVCGNSNELHDAGVAAYSPDIYERHCGLPLFQNVSSPSQTKNEKNVVKVCSTEVTVDRIEEIKDTDGNNDGEVHNFGEGSEPTISEVDADDVTTGHESENTSKIARQSNRDNDVIKNEYLDTLVGYGSDDIEGVQVAKGETESTSVLDFCKILKDGKNANGCREIYNFWSGDENSMFADTMVAEECNTDITQSEGTSAEFQLGEHNDEISPIEHKTSTSSQKGGNLNHEVIFHTEESNLKDHDGSSERIDSMDFEETKDCGIGDYLHVKENTNLEGCEQIEETSHETGSQAADVKFLATTEQECGEQSSLHDGNQTDAGSPLSSPVIESSGKQTVDPQTPLAKETLISIAYSTQNTSLDCQASGLSSDERRSFQETGFLEDDNEKGLVDICSSEQHKQMGDEISFAELKVQDDVHNKLNHETSVGVENTSDESKNNSNGIEMYSMEETTHLLNQSSAFEEPVCAESVDEVEKSVDQENQLVSSHDCSPSKFRNQANNDDSGIESIRCSEVDLLDEVNYKLINFNISSANKFKKVQIHRTPMRISELKNKENTSFVKIEHSIVQTVDKSRRPLQSLQNNARLQQQ